MIPPAASEYAAQVDLIYFALLGVSGLLLAVLLGWIGYSALRFRAGRRPLPRGRVPGGPRLEIAFASGLLACFLVFFVWGGWLYLQAYSDAREMLTINVVGKQWMWKIQHPSGAREINSLHVPVDQPIRLQLSSQDVIHSFSVPALRIKRDALPEQYNQVSFTANRIGVYRLFCAEYCGSDHAGMRGEVVVLSQREYRRWLADNAQPRSLAEEGAELFKAHQCSACHHSGQHAAPELAGLSNTVVRLKSGQQVLADDNYLRRAILQPQAQTVAGYPASMPSYQGQLSELELIKLLAYIKHLDPEEAP